MTPNFVPCGIPLFRVLHSDVISPIFAACWRLVKKAAIHRTSTGETSNVFNLWSIKSKPLEKSVKKIRAAVFPRSIASYIACRRYNKASAVEYPFRAYCRTSILLSNCGSNFVMVKPSIILAKVQVSEIGLKSLSTFFGGGASLWG